MLTWPLKGVKHESAGTVCESALGKRSWITFPSGHMTTTNGVQHVHQHVPTCGDMHRCPGWQSKQITETKEQNTVKGCDFNVPFSTRIVNNCFLVCRIPKSGNFVVIAGSRGLMVAEHCWTDKDLPSIEIKAHQRAALTPLLYSICYHLIQLLHCVWFGRQSGYILLWL